MEQSSVYPRLSSGDIIKVKITLNMTFSTTKCSNTMNFSKHRILFLLNVWSFGNLDLNFMSLLWSCLIFTQKELSKHSNISMM